MALRSRQGYRSGVPNVTAKKVATKSFSYTGGVDTYSDNDDVDPKALVLATDARMVKKGRYKTRKGPNRYTVPVGAFVAGSETAVTGASTQIVNGTRALAQKFTVSATGGITRVEVRVRTTSTSIGTLLVDIYTDAAGSPGTLVATSSILPADVTSSFSYLPVYFISAPSVTATNVRWVVIRGQDSKVGNYEVSTTTNSTNAKVRDGATTWTATTYSLNASIYVAPLNAVKGVYRAYRFNGLNQTFFAAADSLYSVNDVGGTTTAIKTGLNVSASRYRFDMAQDSIYFVNGLEKPYKVALATNTVTQVTTAPEIAVTCMEHKGLMWYVNGVDRNQLFYSKFGVYDEFVSTDFLTMGAPKSPHSIVALAKLNGALYPFARKNKYVILGDSNSTWSIDEATDQRGTFSQESVAFNENYIFHADDDGIHQFNGTDSKNLAEPFLEDYRAIPDKSSIVLELKDNRLYCFYTPAGGTENSQCFVVNVLLGLYEALDLGTYVGRTFARFTQDNIYIQASNRVAALYYGESSSNNYDNLGGQLSYELRTSYGHFDSPGQRKRIPMHRPVFESAPSTYSVDVGYAVDGQTDAQWIDGGVSLSSNSPRFNTGLTFNSGVKFATSGALIEPQNLFIPGEFKRVQRRYRHVAAHEPVEMDSETLAVEIQRMN